MGEVAMDRTETTRVEAILKDELARGNRALRGVAPVVAHLLESSGAMPVSDAIVARLRGMLSHLARQLLAAARPGPLREPLAEGAVDRLADVLAGDEVVLGHLYALAMEGHLTDRLEHRVSLDPVLSPLLQELIASDDPSTAELAMSTLAAQSRFVQSQRRMELGVGELPSSVFARVLEAYEDAMQAEDPPAVTRALLVLRKDYDEGAGRQGLLARLVTAMRGGAIAALALDHAGLALFASAMAALSRQPRDLAVLACHERQAARLALSLRAAGLEAEAIERQFLLLEPVELVPHGLATMPPERARTLLAGSEVADAYSSGAV